MKKVLFTASVAKHILRFHLPYLRWFQEKGFEVHVACEGTEIIIPCNKQYCIPFKRKPFQFGHFSAYRQLKKIIDTENYEIIHCHTPMASVITRIASIKSRKNGTRVLYTAHGFHFYKGSSILSWILYFPLEYLLFRFTDRIITINKEDFDLVSKYQSKNFNVSKIPGVGVDKKKFKPITKIQKKELRSKHKIDQDRFVLIYAAEFIPRKNHLFVLRSIDELRHRVPKLLVLFAGRGELTESLRNYIEKYHFGDTVEIIGFREDIHEFFQLSDVGISASKQEGLGLNLIEEMMCGLPVVATRDRGHCEVIDHEKNGLLFEQNDSNGFIEAVVLLNENEELMNKLSLEAKIKSSQFELSEAKMKMIQIYSRTLN